jgi:hypothetical protein
MDEDELTPEQRAWLRLDGATPMPRRDLLRLLDMAMGGGTLAASQSARLLSECYRARGALARPGWRASRVAERLGPAADILQKGSEGSGERA